MKKILILFICILGFSSCMKKEDLFDPDRVQEEAKKNFPVQDVDPDHDWNMMGIAEMAASVNNGTGLTYNLKICTDNPFNIDNNARLLYQVSVKDGETKSFSFDAPLALTDLFVAVEAPDYSRFVVPATMKDGKFTVKIGGNARKARSVSSRVHALSVDYTLDDAAFNCPADAKKITQEDIGWGILSVKGNCYIDTDITCENLNVDESSDARLYIKSGGTLSVEEGYSGLISLNRSTKFISILEGGKLLCNTDNGIDLSGGKIYNRGAVQVTNKEKENSGITMSAGLFYNQGTLEVKKGDLALSGTAKFINATGGQLTTKDNDLDVKVTSGGEFLNEEDATVEVDETEISGGKWVNNGKYTTEEMDITGSRYEVQNNCKLLIGTSKGDGEFTLKSAVTFSNSGYVYCKSAEFGSGTIAMTANSVFKVDGEAEYYSNFTVQGPDSNGEAYLIMKSTKYAGKQEVGNGYVGNLIVVCDNYFPANKNDKKPALPGPDGFPIYPSDGLTINIPASECSDGHHQEVTPPDPIPVAVYTFAFEDSSTSGGDYDFNDVVLKVETVPAGGKLKVKLVAAGATKDLQVLFEDKALFNGQEVHAAMGCPSGVMINTGGATGTVAEDMVSWPDGYTLKENGNFSIYDVKKQLSVKLPLFIDGFKKGDVPYGIVVPIDWEYPVEGERVDKKYPKFADWAKDAQKEAEWYK